MPADVENTRLVVAGRTFRPVTPASVRHFQYVTGPLLASGAYEADTIGEQVAAITSVGKGPELLAGLYTEDDGDGQPRPWTLREAKRYAEAFGAIVNPTEWSAMTLALYAGLRRFFGRAPGSSETIPISSDPTTGPASGDPEPSADLAASGSPSSP